MELPFELSKTHKSDTKSNWKKYGLITDEFEEIYQQYIYSTNCEICGKIYESRNDRHMDHSHATGKFRNVCCQKCNLRKRDVKIKSTNTSGYKHISQYKEPRCKQGFRWVFEVTVNCKRKWIKSSIDLEKVIQFRDKWFKEHPDYHT